MKELGFDQGVLITRPWNPDMYAHNAIVSKNKKQHVLKALTTAYRAKDENALREISKAICAYGFGDGYTLKDIYNNTKRELDNMADWYMYEWCWPDLIKKGHVLEINVEFVGYKK